MVLTRKFQKMALAKIVNNLPPKLMKELVLQINALLVRSYYQMGIVKIVKTSQGRLINIHVELIAAHQPRE